MNRLSIPLEAAQEGMVLADTLHDAGGNVLLPRGATLGEATLNSLRRRGIETLTIVAPDAPPDPEREAARREALERQMRQLFRHAGDDATILTLRQTLLDYRLERGS